MTLNFLGLRRFLRNRLSRMSQDNFEIAYDGPEVRDGNMDVYELAPGLLAIGDLIQDVNRFYNQDRATVSIQVQSDFKRGSFAVSLLVDHGMIEQARQALFGGGIESAKQLIELIFGTSFASSGIVFGLIKLYKALKGRKPEPREIKFIDNSTTLIQNINVDSQTANLYLNDAIRNSMDKAVLPVAKEGIDKLEVRKNAELLEQINKNDLPERVLEGPTTSTDKELSSTREAHLLVVKVNFEKGKWTFSDGTTKFNADLNDPAFRQKLDNRDLGFFKGDALHVILKTTQTVAPTGKFHTEHAIQQVLGYEPAPTQTRLLPPGKSRGGGS